MMVDAYHGTTTKRAESICRTGFVMPKGRGVYFAGGPRGPEFSKQFGEATLKVRLDTDDFLNLERESREGILIDEDEMRERVRSLGKVGWRTDIHNGQMELVVSDREYASSLRPSIYVGSFRLKRMCGQPKGRRPIRAHRRSR